MKLAIVLFALLLIDLAPPCAGTTRRLRQGRTLKHSGKEGKKSEKQPNGGDKKSTDKEDKGSAKEKKARKKSKKEKATPKSGSGGCTTEDVEHGDDGQDETVDDGLNGLADDDSGGTVEDGVDGSVDYASDDEVDSGGENVDYGSNETDDETSNDSGDDRAGQDGSEGPADGNAGGTTDEYIDDEPVGIDDEGITNGGTDDDTGAVASVCGCVECTFEVLNRMAGGFSCGDRIAYLQTGEGGLLPEFEACAVIGGEFPGICTPCNPLFCDGQAPTFCGCSTCTLDTWDSLAGAFTCGARISYLQTPDGGSESEEAACLMISQNFPNECGLCDPTTCA